MWNEPRKYLIVFTQRGGSAFLAHCLDSHVEIGCERGEPLLKAHPWLQAFPQAPPEEILAMLLDRPGYPVTVARISYRQLREVSAGFIEGLDGVIHLHRHNAVRILVSAEINTQCLKVPHTYNTHLQPAQVEMDPQKLMADIAKYINYVGGTREELHNLDVPLLLLRYDEIVGGEGQEAFEIPRERGKDICKFLGVDYSPLHCWLKRTNPEPLSRIISNWPEIKAALIEAGHGHYLGE